MIELDRQLDYWDNEGPKKSFGHPINLQRLNGLLSLDSLIVDFGCGYGRCLGELFDSGYRNLFGFDFSPAMIAAARERFPKIQFEVLDGPTCLLRQESVDAALLFSVLTCVPTDDGQRAILEELRRVMKPGGILYISDLWLQSDARNVERYKRDQPKYGTYGVFDLPEGVTVRHHSRDWIESLTTAFVTVAVDDIDVLTMNGNPAKAFQWFASKPF